MSSRWARALPWVFHFALTVTLSTGEETGTGGWGLGGLRVWRGRREEAQAGPHLASAHPCGSGLTSMKPSRLNQTQGGKQRLTDSAGTPQAQAIQGPPASAGWAPDPSATRLPRAWQSGLSVPGVTVAPP